MKKLLMALTTFALVMAAAACFAAPVEVTDATYDKEVTQSKLPVILELWRPGCKYCKAMGPIIDKLSEELEGKVKVVKMNTSENTKVPATFTYPGVPAFFYIKDGKTVASTIGAMEKDELKHDLGIK